MSGEQGPQMNSAVESAPHVSMHADALELIKRAYDQVNAGLQVMADLDAAYEIATRLADGMRKLADDAALTRAKCAAEISDAENLSRRKLAERLGISKARADQLIRVARDKSAP